MTDESVSSGGWCCVLFRAAAVVWWIHWALSTKFSFDSEDLWAADAWQRSQQWLMCQHVQVMILVVMIPFPAVVHSGILW